MKFNVTIDQTFKAPLGIEGRIRISQVCEAPNRAVFLCDKLRPRLIRELWKFVDKLPWLKRKLAKRYVGNEAHALEAMQPLAFANAIVRYYNLSNGTNEVPATSLSRFFCWARHKGLITEENSAPAGAEKEKK